MEGKSGPRTQEVAAALCGLMAVEHLAKHFKTQISLRNRYKKGPRGVSDAGVWAFAWLRLGLSLFISENTALGLGLGGFGVLAASPCPLSFGLWLVTPLGTGGKVGTGVSISRCEWSQEPEVTPCLLGRRRARQQPTCKTSGLLGSANSGEKGALRG